MIDFAKKLKQLRYEKKLTQPQLAKYLDITKSMGSAYETSITIPSLDVLNKLSKFFDFFVDCFLGG